MTNAQRLLRGMLRLRGVFIKLGQVLSILGGFLPRPYTRELESLQDHVPPHPFRDVERTFLAAYGKGPDACFAAIEHEPIAAASLGQVHAAVLNDGTKVAVKVLYPRIRDVIRVDMRALKLIIARPPALVPAQHLETVHRSLVDLLRRETDYVHEAACMERMAKNFAGEKDILFPTVVHEWTTKDILTMSFMEGVKITRFDELDRLGIDRTRLATRLVQSFYKQLFVDRFFHADPHPGNFLVQRGEGGEPRIVVLDFGAISEVTGELVDGALQVLQGILTQDGAMALRGFREMGFVAEGANEKLLEQTVMTYFKKLLKVKDHSAGALLRADRRDLEKLASPEVERDELRDLMRSDRATRRVVLRRARERHRLLARRPDRSGARHDEHRRARTCCRSSWSGRSRPWRDSQPDGSSATSAGALFARASVAPTWTRAYSPDARPATRKTP